MHQIFQPFRYGNLVGVENRSGKRREDTAAAEAAISSSSVPVVAASLESVVSAVRTGLDEKSVHKTEF